MVIENIFPTAQTVFSWDDHGIGKNLMLMFATSIVAFVVLNLLEVGGIKLIKSFIFGFMRRNNPYIDAATVDSDVQAEKERIDRMSVRELQSETMIMQNVSKFYGEFCAVNQISVAIKRYTFIACERVYILIYTCCIHFVNLNMFQG